MFLWLPTDARRRRLAIFSAHFGHFYFGVCVQEKYEIKKVWDWRGSASSLLHPFRSDIFYARRAVRSEDSLVKNLSWRSSVTPDSLRFGWFLFWKRTSGENFGRELSQSRHVTGAYKETKTVFWLGAHRSERPSLWRCENNFHITNRVAQPFARQEILTQKAIYSHSFSARMVQIVWHTIQTFGFLSFSSPLRCSEEPHEVDDVKSFRSVCKECTVLGIGKHRLVNGRLIYTLRCSCNMCNASILSVIASRQHPHASSASSPRSLRRECFK